jgi:hypothetical protein
MFVVSVAAVIWGVLLGQIGFISRSFVRRKNKKTHLPDRPLAVGSDCE